jgi:hypothetical protein
MPTTNFTGHPTFKTIKSVGRLKPQQLYINEKYLYIFYMRERIH